MEESKRQKQVSKVIEQELNEIFLRKGWNIMGKGMLSIARVKITPDLYEARVFLSMFQIDDKEELLKTIKAHDWEIRKELGLRIKNQMRKIPTLTFYIDDTLDYVANIEKVLERIKKTEGPASENEEKEDEEKG